MPTPISIADTSVQRGDTAVVHVPVTQDLDGNAIALTVHAVVGAKPGPTLALLSTLHGGEWQSIEVIRRVLDRLDPAVMRGNVLAVPVGNPVALGRLTRNTPDESDAADLNRVFPGGGAWIADQMAAAITTEVLDKSDAMLDFHMGLWGASLTAVLVGTDYPADAVNAGSMELAKSFGFPCIHQAQVMSTFPGPRSSIGYFGGVLGKPSLGIEIGGAGFGPEWEERWLAANVDGTFNVLRHLDILAEAPQLPERYLVWSKRWRVNPGVGGYLVPSVEPNRLLGEVAGGEQLGRVLSPYSLDQIEELTAPGNGILFYTARSYPVRPGDWGFGVIDADHPDTRWESS